MSPFELNLYFGIFYCFVVLEYVLEIADFSLSFGLAVFGQLYSTDCELNDFFQSIPSKGMMSVLSVITISIFCLLFSYSMFTGIFPRNFTSFLLTYWYRFVTFCISVGFNIRLLVALLILGIRYQL